MDNTQPNINDEAGLEKPDEILSTAVKCVDGTEIPVYCAYNDTVLTELVTGNPKNPNQHPPNQIELLAKIIKGQGWRAPITISTRSKLVVKGHGRLEAAKALGCESVPVDYQDYASEEAEIADLLADNKIAELAHINNALELSNKAFLEAAQFDLELAGFDDFEKEDHCQTALQEKETGRLTLCIFCEPCNFLHW